MSKPTTESAICVARVVQNAQICDEHYRLVVSMDHLPPTAPGQFIQILCDSPGGPSSTLSTLAPSAEDGWPMPNTAELTEARAFLRRPISISARSDSASSTELEFIYRTVGVGTGWLGSVKPGDKLDLLGPLGNRFRIDADKPLAAMIGGGVGIPPMIYLAQSLASAGKQAVCFAGARSANLLPLSFSGKNLAEEVSSTGQPTMCTAEFSACGAATSISTDDGSLGLGGLVTKPLERWLDSLDDPAGRLAVYTCGPEPMMRAVAHLCGERNIFCQVSLERHMACGMGTCQSCVCKTHTDGPDGWAFKLCCTDGPVFDAADVIWD